mmetsp:Transcript_23723/g.66631  ORF Transcript_23723/g.66631 Transcript_23723/m.66631 type:complete len:273 (+) Transcript_23723:424-1242(+)
MARPCRRRRAISSSASTSGGSAARVTRRSGTTSGSSPGAAKTQAASGAGWTSTTRTAIWPRRSPSTSRAWSPSTTACACISRPCTRRSTRPSGTCPILPTYVSSTFRARGTGEATPGWQPAGSSCLSARPSRSRNASGCRLWGGSAANTATRQASGRGSRRQRRGSTPRRRRRWRASWCARPAPALASRRRAWSTCALLRQPRRPWARAQAGLAPGPPRRRPPRGRRWRRRRGAAGRREQRRCRRRRRRMHRLGGGARSSVLQANPPSLRAP